MFCTISAALVLAPALTRAASLPGPAGTHATGSTVGAVKYLGFWGPGTPAEMSGFTNLAFVNYGDLTVHDATLNQQHGISSLLKLESIFVNYSVSFEFTLLPDYEARWAAAAPAITALLQNKSTGVIGFFLGDEMLWNGLTLAELQTYAQAVRATFPPGTAIIYTNAAWPTQLPTMPGQPQRAGAIAAVPDANLWKDVPAELDWFSVDVYPNEASVAGYINMMHAWVLPKLLPHQQLVLVPPFYGSKGVSTTRMLLDCDDYDCDAAMTRWANFTQGWVDGSLGLKDAERIVAVTPYHYLSLGNGTGSRALGGKELPRASASWEAFGKKVVARNAAPEPGNR